MICSGRVAYHPALAPLMQDIDSVQPHPENYNNGDLEEIDQSFFDNGMYRPVQVQASTRYILAGNSTWEVAKSNDASIIPVVELDVDDETALRIMLTDNKTAAKAVPDRGQELSLVRRLAQTEKGLRGSGYTEHDAEQLERFHQIAAGFDEWGAWPTISVQVPPHLRQAFYALTEPAVDMRERFEILLRLAGWEGPETL